MMSRGFVTIATGSDKYFKLAANLLRSYRLYSPEPEPFAIICDRLNEYTDLFDEAVVMDDPQRSYVDKIRLPEYIPFDENIFIDADCLAYKDLNDFWQAFEGADDFSVFGRNYPLDYRYGWFRPEDIGVYKDKVSYIPDFIGGVYFLRKTEELEDFSKTCNHVWATYYDYKFRQFEDPCDEPVFALSMALHGYRTAGNRSPDICFYPHTTYFQSDISEGTVKYSDRYQKERGVIPEAYMVHWGSGNTRQDAYLKEEYRLNWANKGKKA